MSFSNLLQVSDWKLTSLGGMSVAFPFTKVVSFGVSAVPMEFTNARTGLVRTFTGRGIGGSVSAVPSISKWLRGKFSASFSPSTFPSSGEVITMLAARDPFYIDAIRGYWGQMVSGGLDLGFTAGVGAIVFQMFPPAGPIAVFADGLAIAVCFFKTTGLSVGGGGVSGGQDIFQIS